MRRRNVVAGSLSLQPKHVGHYRRNGVEGIRAALVARKSNIRVPQSAFFRTSNSLRIPLPEQLLASMTVHYRLSPRQLEIMNLVFNVPKLLEHILSFLSAQALLQLRAVCKEMKLMIEDSPRIRQIMFRESPLNSQPTLDPAPKLAFVSALAPYHIRGITRKITQAKGKHYVVLAIDSASYRSAYYRYLRHSRMLRSIQLAQPAPDSVTLYRDCACEQPETSSVPGGGVITFANVFRAINAFGRKCKVCHNCQRFRIRANYI